MLSENEFTILQCLVDANQNLTRRAIADATGLSLGTTSSTCRRLEATGLMAAGSITPEGKNALEPYKVNNAVIMAAGLSSRFVPLSYERPKGMLRVRGEVLIERQIEQLRERGITDITVVVGYKKEFFFYLVEKYGVELVVNEEYSTRNNSWTLWLVRDRLANTYICSSDNYFTVNPFERYVYQAYYASVYVDGPTDEWCIGTSGGGRITSTSIGGQDSWILLGHAYFDQGFSQTFVQILDKVINEPATHPLLWESVFASHMKELNMKARHYDPGVIYEFDSLAELESFDEDFIGNVDSTVFDNIEKTLGCKRGEIHGFYPMKKGLTNLSCHFAVGDREYVYRYPGIGTEKLVDRFTEAKANEAARALGLDSRLIRISPDQGWKISEFVPNARNVNPKNPDDVRRIMKLCRTIHEADVHLDAKFDFYANGIEYENLLKEHGSIEIPGYYELKAKVSRINEHAKADGYPLCFSHNDYLALNFLIDGNDHIDVIDWEYAGMSDPMNDIATFIVCSEYDMAKGNQTLEYYFGRTPTFNERRHLWSMVVLAGWCWYVWALVKEAEGASAGEWLYIYYSYAAKYADAILSRYEGTTNTWR